MTILSIFAMGASVLVLGFGVATIVAERGYRFDLRRGRRATQPGGRRDNDAVLRAR
jgi:hypothetical protein